MKKLFTLLALTISFSMNAQTGNTSTGTNALASGSLTGSNNSAFGYGLYLTPRDSNTASGMSLYILTSKGKKYCIWV